MSGKAIIPLVAGLVIGGLALKMGSDALKRAQGGQQVKGVTVWSAARDIVRGQRVEASMLSSVSMPPNAVPEGAFTDREELVGRVARTTRLAGDVLTESAMRPKGAPTGLEVPEGMRAVAVKVDESSGVDYHLEPGSHVDVVAYFNIRTAGKQETVARTIIENVEVGAVGQRVSAELTTEHGDEGKKSTSTARPVRAVTLFVKPAQVPTLHLAEQRGKLKLSMRNSIEGSGHTKHRSVDEGEVLGHAKPTVAKVSTGLAGWLFGKAKPQVEAEPTKSAEPTPPVTKAAPNPLDSGHMTIVYSGKDRMAMWWPGVHSQEPPVAVAEDDLARYQKAPLLATGPSSQSPQPNRTSHYTNPDQPLATDPAPTDEPEPEELEE